LSYINNLTDIKNFQQFDNLEFIAKQVVEGFIIGLHRSPYHGFSVEFAEHRIYNEGDSTKHIDWKLYARTDKLFVKKYEEETNLRCQIVIDTSSSMLFPFPESKIMNKLSFSAYCSAALIYLLRKQRDAAGLSLISDTVELHSLSKLSPVHAQMLYSELNQLINRGRNKDLINKETKTSELLHFIAENTHKRSLVIIFSDIIENADINELFSALQHLRFNKHEVILFHVSDRQKEENFIFDNRPYKFIDLETKETVKVNPNDVREFYSNKMSTRFNELRNKCTQYNIDIVESDINEDFRKVLLSFLIKRNKLF